MKKRKKAKPEKEIKLERVQPWDHLLCRYCQYPFILIDVAECPNCKCSVDLRPEDILSKNADNL